MTQRTESTSTQGEGSLLHAKLAHIQGELGVIVKTGHNERQGYSFANEQAFLDALKPMTSAQGLSLVFSTDTLVEYRTEEKQDGKGNVKYNYVAVVHGTLTITDSETGEFIQARSVGVGHDSGDKAVYKAMTGASKYAYWKAFGLATGDDPENDEPKERKTLLRKKSNYDEDLI